MDVISDFSLTKALFIIALLGAVSFDITSYRIPNTVIVVLLVLFAIVSLFGSTEVNWLDHLLAGGVCFIGGIIFYGLGQMGAGDVKLLGTVALWGGIGALLPLVFWISLSGLLLIAVLLLLRWLAPLLQASRIVSMPASLPRVLVRGEGVPYGVAIGIGTLVALPYFQTWLWMF